MPRRRAAPGILFVEDDWFVARETADALWSAGCEVIGPVPSVGDAEDLLDREAADVALLDIELLDGTTFDLARRLRDRRFPVVFHSSRDRRDRPFDLADAMFCTKPTDPGPLVAAVAARHR